LGGGYGSSVSSFVGLGSWGLEAGDPDQALGYYLRGEPVNGRTFDPPRPVASRRLKTPQ
jgi:hypothetical protein